MGNWDMRRINDRLARYQAGAGARAIKPSEQANVWRCDRCGYSEPVLYPNWTVVGKEWHMCPECVVGTLIGAST